MSETEEARRSRDEVANRLLVARKERAAPDAPPEEASAGGLGEAIERLEAALDDLKGLVGGAPAAVYCPRCRKRLVVKGRIKCPRCRTELEVAGREA